MTRSRQRSNSTGIQILLCTHDSCSAELRAGSTASASTTAVPYNLGFDDSRWIFAENKQSSSCKGTDSKCMCSRKSDIPTSCRACSVISTTWTGSHRIDVVFNVYQEISIENVERCNRGAYIAPGQTINQWRKFLHNPYKKTSLIKYMIEEWNKPEHKGRLGDHMWRALFQGD